MNPILEYSHTLARSAALQAIDKIDLANSIHIKSRLSLRPDGLVDRVAIRSDIKALKAAIFKVVQLLPVFERFSQGYGLGNFAVNAIDDSKLKGKDGNFSDTEVLVVEWASKNKVPHFKEAMEFIAGKLAQALIEDEKNRLHVIREDELIKNTLVVPVNQVISQVDEPQVVMVVSRRDLSKGLPTVVRYDRGRGDSFSLWRNTLQSKGFLREKDAVSVTTKSRLLVLGCLPVFIRAFQDTPMYKK